MKPYYERNGITIYNADCREVIESIDPATVALVHADGPYGINLDTSGRGGGRTFGKGTAPLKSRSFPPIVGDDQPFDPSHLLRFPKLVTWGANHYSDKLPQSPSWLMWDKREDFGSDNGGDGELAWSNLGGPIRIFRHLWKGTCRASEAGPEHPHLHPTQKPVALCSWVFQRAGLKPGDLVVVPYLGSGPELPAARSLGLRVIGIEIVEAYCETAVTRLRQEVLPFGIGDGAAEKVGAP